MNEEGSRESPGPENAGESTGSISKWIGRDWAQSEARNPEWVRQLVTVEPGVRGAILYGGKKGQDVLVSELLCLWVAVGAGHHEVV